MSVTECGNLFVSTEALAQTQARQFPCVGYVELVFYDDLTNEVMTLGGAGYLTAAEEEQAWLELASVEGDSCFQAHRLDADHCVFDTKPVSAVECERLTGKPLAHLIYDARAALRGEARRSVQVDPVVEELLDLLVDVIAANAKH